MGDFAVFAGNALGVDAKVTFFDAFIMRRCGAQLVGP
jgi:hypothetical protein